MPQTPEQQRVTDAVAAELAKRGWTHADLSAATREPDSDKPAVDGGTIGDFLAYKRWPKIGTLGRFERALGWPAGSLRQLHLNGTPIPERDESVSPSSETERVPAWNTRVPEGMTDEQHKEIVREAEEFYRWKIQQASQER